VFVGIAVAIVVSVIIMLIFLLPDMLNVAQEVTTN
jgi:cell division protein FtsL